MATISIILMTQGSSAVVGPENNAKKVLAKHIQRLYNEFGDSWIYRYSSGDTVSVSGDINDFQIAKVV